MELNPNHPVTTLMREHDVYAKVLMILMLKLNMREFEITKEDADLLGNMTHGLITDTRGGRFIIKVLPLAEAEAEARKEGGLPV